MVSLEQIRILENKITKACDLIGLLKKENATLKRAVESSQKRMSELELFINQFKNEQVEIESGIMNVLKKLDDLEDDVSETKSIQDHEKDQDTKSSVKSTRVGSGKEKKTGTLSPDLYDKQEQSSGSETTILRDSGTGVSVEDETPDAKQEAELDIF